MLVKNKRLAIDFDGVIHDYAKLEWPLFGNPMLDAQPSMQKLKRLGNHISIFSSRAYDQRATAEIMNWLQQHRIPFDEVTNIKGSVDYFIDDKAIHFDTWGGVLDALKSR